MLQNLSGYLAKVKTGSAFTVTDRGKPVAVLAPLATEDDTWQRLVDDGVVVPATAGRGRTSNHPAEQSIRAEPCPSISKR